MGFLLCFPLTIIFQATRICVFSSLASSHVKSLFRMVLTFIIHACMHAYIHTYIHTYIHLIATTLSYKNEKKGKENTQIGIH